MKRATLKQIAEMAGVSLTTVHRALNGKGGCSRDVEERIIQIAKEQGYSINFAAASLRKSTLNIALIFPFRDNGGRFYIDRILDGYLECRREATPYNVVLQEFLLRSNDQKLEDYLDMEYPELEKVLRQICQEQPTKFDGIIIYGKSITHRTEAILNRIIDSGTRVVVIDRMIDSLEDTCCIRSNDTISGNMAAEMLCRDIRKSGTVLIISQSVPGGDPCGEVCARGIAEERPDLKTVLVPLIMNADVSDAIVREMEKIPDLVGMYVTNGRHTHSALKAIEKNGCKPDSVIGTEVFAETYQALKGRGLEALIDKRPEKIGYTALNMLITSLYTNGKLPSVEEITPRIVLRSNSDAYYVKRGSHYDPEEYTGE